MGIQAPETAAGVELPLKTTPKEYENNLTSRLSRLRIILNFMINLRPNQLDIAVLDIILLQMSQSMMRHHHLI